MLPRLLKLRHSLLTLKQPDHLQFLAPLPVCISWNNAIAVLPCTLLLLDFFLRYVGPDYNNNINGGLSVSVICLVVIVSVLLLCVYVLANIAMACAWPPLLFLF